jgi:hypothetical protein
MEVKLAKHEMGANVIKRECALRSSGQSFGFPFCLRLLLVWGSNNLFHLGAIAVFRPQLLVVHAA